ncbi:hypothetical protein PF010_g28708 [Phytophthora fragariae]|nr:hypothetical protein PF003_g12882 [Phytophthora fragariae]KAE8920138.1 hypothetical protein PF009_g29566 [Phytophthora fragariae]KAE9064183.1 hypothetical protein PF010_g28708 [Phytophthora fragariae]KAE9068811.1 hypothetical protein PF006_g29713 [Phytophthora fragariae]KAE9169418.1 hypothetical protein PF004_g28185 [Phytophthora fragariae]
MAADGLTKALGRQRFNLLQGLVGLRSSNGPRVTVPADLENSPTPN